MEPVWHKPDLAEQIIKTDDVSQLSQSIAEDIVAGRLDITSMTESMASVLTNQNVHIRERGMIFFTQILKEIPKDYLTEKQIKFISKFYVDRLQDNHRVIPAVLEGYLAFVDMKNYDVKCSGEYFTALFRDVVCQSQVRQDRYNIYMTVKKILDLDATYLKSLGPDFICGLIVSMNGERDPRNLLYLFNFLPEFLRKVPLGHLVEEVFEVISCYYPIDFHPSPNDPAAVSRNDLAAALCPCLCAVPVFGEQCLILLIEKLDSSLRVAKIDSLKLLIVPLAIDALEYDNKDLLLVMIDLLTHFVRANNSIMTESLQTILPRLINLTTYAKSMDIRTKSLQCVYEVANCCATPHLLPHKQTVLLALAPALDDPKRLTRRAAVQARTRWFLVGAPGEE
ncbi:jg15297 [Pararge aegeria aegeria]|uniref:MMS19 nucleotide excision repair protein n=1 Tax=Pararge aegeria aegeria TaxID=348720 RepID=A0A8S4R414_9NEOP|nr:jg15297 [Pararge aegeria aegeria]